MQEQPQGQDCLSKAAQDFINYMHEQNKANGWIKYIEPKTINKPMVVKRSFWFWLKCLFSSKYTAIYRAYCFFESRVGQHKRADLQPNEDISRYTLKSDSLIKNLTVAIKPNDFSELMAMLYAVDNVVEVKPSEKKERKTTGGVKGISEFDLMGFSKKTVPDKFLNILVDAHNEVRKLPQSSKTENLAQQNNLVGELQNHFQQNPQLQHAPVLGSENQNKASLPTHMQISVQQNESSPKIPKIQSNPELQKQLLEYFGKFDKKQLKEYLLKLDFNHCQDLAQVIVAALEQIQGKKNTFNVDSNQLTFLFLCYQKFRDLTSFRQATDAENLIKGKINAILKKVQEIEEKVITERKDRPYTSKNLSAVLKIFCQPIDSAVATENLMLSQTVQPIRRPPLDGNWPVQLEKIIRLANPEIKEEPSQVFQSPISRSPSQNNDLNLELTCQTIIQQLQEPFKNSSTLIQSLKSLQQALNKNKQLKLPEKFFNCMQALVNVLNQNILIELQNFSKNPLVYKIPENFQQWLQASELLSQIGRFSLDSQHVGYQVYKENLLAVKNQIRYLLFDLKIDSMEKILKANKDKIVNNAYSTSTKQYYREKFATLLKIYGPLVLAFGTESQKNFYNENFSQLNATKENQLSLIN